MKPAVLLFDMDGVLVQPGGYRAAVRATVNYFTNQLGLGDQAPDDETVAIFEAQGITCEWDMVPLLIATILDRAVQAAGEQSRESRQLESLLAAQQWLRAQRPEGLHIDFPTALRRLGTYIRPGEAPADTILAVCQNGGGAALFPGLSGQGVLQELLAHSRQLAGSRTTAVFETFALGDFAFAEATGLPIQVHSESLLAQFDQPLLNAQTRQQLLHLRAAGRVQMIAYTARPSLPLREPDELLAVYTPEAEMALEHVGMDPFPLIGSGQMGEAARRLGEAEDRLTKPTPYHALAAIAAAWSGDRLAALDWTEAAFCHFERGAAQPGLRTSAGPLPERLDLHIFEDSPAGMQGGQEAVQLLGRLGMQVDLHLWGIANHAEKAAALQAVGAKVFADINQAVAAAIPML